MDLCSKQGILELRSRVQAGIRTFFMGEGYIEVTTPVRVTAPALEDHIDAESCGEAWLRTSPELHMKRMVCAGFERIYQLGPCFRRGERGQRHLPEYTMLEWYRVGADSTDLMDETLRLIRAVASLPGLEVPADVGLDHEPMIMTVQDAFWLWAGWDPVEAFDENRFDEDLDAKIEPMIAEQSCPVILKDFPAARSALARTFPDRPQVADRWELYLGGMELANAYTELTDADEQRKRFDTCAEGRRQRGQEIYPIDGAFMSALENGMPDCAGIALGLDRLLMVLTGETDIANLVAFPEG